MSECSDVIDIYVNYHAIHSFMIMLSLQWSVFAGQSYRFDWWSWFPSSASTCTGIYYLFTWTISSSFYYWANIGCNSIYFQLPEEARELDKEVRQIIKEKEEAVRNQDFEKVISL